jgi:hypothetical protein
MTLRMNGTSVSESNAIRRPILRSRYRTLCLVHLEFELLRDEARNALHHPLPARSLRT